MSLGERIGRKAVDRKNQIPARMASRRAKLEVSLAARHEASGTTALCPGYDLLRDTGRAYSASMEKRVKAGGKA